MPSTSALKVELDSRPEKCAVFGCQTRATQWCAEQTRDHDLEIELWLCGKHFSQWARPKNRV